MNKHNDEIEEFNEKFLESENAYICLICDQNDQKSFDTKSKIFDHIFDDHKKNPNKEISDQEKNPVEEISEYEKIQQENIAQRKAQMAKLFPELSNKENCYQWRIKYILNVHEY